MKILALVSDGSENSMNGATKVMLWVRELMSHQNQDVDFLVRHVLYYSSLAEQDLVVCFGSGASTHLLGQGALKIRRREMVVNEWDHNVIVTFNADTAVDSAQWTKTLCEDVLWGLRETTITRFLPQLDMKDTGVMVGFDVETVGDVADMVRGRLVTVAANEMGTAYDMKLFMEDLFHDTEYPIKRTICGHNLKYDLKWALREDISFDHVYLHDTSIAAALLDDNIADNSLDFLRSRLTDIRPYKGMVNVTQLDKEDVGEVLRYNKYDAVVSRKVANQQLQPLQDGGFEPIFELLMDLLPVYARMENRGVNIDRDVALEVWTEALDLKAQALKKLDLEESVLKSPKQMQKILYEDRGFPIKKRTATKQPSVDAEALERIYEETQDEFVQWILEYRDGEKVHSTYLAKLPEFTQYDGRIHPDYSLSVGEFGGAKTGRTSCRRPNLQNIPRGHGVRRMYVPTEGYLWGDADHSQLELRIAGWLSGDERMLTAFRNKWDIHTATLSDLWSLDYEEAVQHMQGGDRKWYERRIATKRVNFGILYGIGAKKLSAMLRREGISMSVGECQEIIDKWRDNYYGFGKWAEAIQHEAFETGCVHTITGRRRTLPDANPDTFEGWRAQRQAVNFPVQSLASDITQIGIYLLDKVFKNYDAHLLMNVHDEIAWEYRGCSPEEMAKVAKHVMEDETKDEFNRRFGVELDVPLQADTHMGERWME